MTSLRARSLLASVALASAGLVVVGAADTASATDVNTCASPATPRPCIVPGSFTQNGGAVDGGIDFNVGWEFIGAARQLRLTVTKGSDPDLGFAYLDDTFSVTFDMGTAFIPRVVDGFAQNVTVTRNNVSGNYFVTVTGNPVTLSGQCDQSTPAWICPEEGLTNGGTVDNNQQWDATFDVIVDDFGQWLDAPSRSAIYGMNFFTNIAATGLPPDVLHDSTTDTDYLRILLANRRFLDGGTTLVSGHVEMRIPNQFLRLAYGVPNPELMTGSSLAPTVTGTASPGTITVTQESGDDAMLIDIDGMRFPDVLAPARTARATTSSLRALKIKRGTITPTRPKVTKAKRVTAGKARITFEKAKARGAKITGYQVRCKTGKSAVFQSGKYPTITVTGLKPGRAYDCQVRAKSKAGKGKFSRAKHLAARP